MFHLPTPYRWIGGRYTETSGESVAKYRDITGSTDNLRTKARNVTGADRASSPCWLGPREVRVQAGQRKSFARHHAIIPRQWDGCAPSVPILSARPSIRLWSLGAHFGISLRGSASAKWRCTGIGRPTFPEKGVFPSLHLRSAGPASGSGLEGWPSSSSPVASATCGGRLSERQSRRVSELRINAAVPALAQSPAMAGRIGCQPAPEVTWTQ